MQICRINPGDIDVAASFIMHQQAIPAHHIGYFGMDTADIAATIREFTPPDNGLLAVEEGIIVGALYVGSVYGAWIPKVTRFARLSQAINYV